MNSLPSDEPTAGDDAVPAVRKIRVDFRRNRSSKARKKDWGHLAGGEEEEKNNAPTTERVVPKGDISRKRTITVSDEGPAGIEQLQGTVVSIDGPFCMVDDGRRVWPCTLRRVLRTRRIEHRSPVIVGDQVYYSLASAGDAAPTEGVIESVAPRRNELGRRSGKRIHALVANVDQALIITSARSPDPKPHLIDRYIVAALAGRIRPVLCMNKIDLDPEGDYRQIVDRYARLGCPALMFSAQTGEGVEPLRELLRGKSSVVAGQSGVGKSSILNAVQPGLNLAIGDIIDHTTKGRHTTTTARLIRLECGGYVVDTPGTKSFDVSAVSKAELELYFEEFVPFVPDCKFPDCTHTHETGCAVLRAVEAGHIHPDRHASYARLYEESPT